MVNSQTDKSGKRSSAVNRRTVLSSLSAIGVTSIAGCSAEDPDNTDSTADNHLEFAVEDTIESLNPMLNASVSGYAACSQLYSSLVIIGPEGELYGDLATDWDSSEDATEWTFQLNEDATWHHSGDPVTATDVEATFEKVNDPDTGSPGIEVISNIEEIEATDQFEFSITLSEGDADVAAKTNNQWLRIMPQEVVEDDELFNDAATEDFGSGPFELNEFQRGNFSTYDRFEDYHLTDDDGNQLPYVDELTMHVYPEESTMRAEMQGDLDLLTIGYPASVFEDLRDEPGIVDVEAPSGLCYPLLMNPNSEPFDDRRVRHAIKHAVDKTAVLEVAGRGLGTLGKDNFVSPAHRFYADLDDPFGPESQPEEAEALLEEAGYEDGLEIPMPLQTPSDFGAPIRPTAVVIQDNCAEVGIDIEIEEVSTDFWLSNVEGDGDFYMGLYSFRPIEDEILRQVLHSDGPWSYGFANEDFDTAIDQARVTPDESERLELYTEAQEIAQMNAGMIVPYFSDSLGLHKERVINYEEHPSDLKLDIQEVQLE